MTDYDLVQNELIKILHCDEAQLEEYQPYINNAIAGLSSVLKSAEDEDDVRIVNLCAVKAYYQIILTSDAEDGIVSFTAGDVSYKKDSSAVEKAKALVDMAMDNCCDLVQSGSFAFKAV
ncbi:MAG: hypothetical protein ACI4RF_02940 [Eubacterium sp.]